MPIRFLALGDSYTAGEAVAARDAWPAQLVRVLNDQGVPVSPAEMIAKTGWTTGDLLDAIARRQQPGERYDLVSLQIGVNDQYAGCGATEYDRKFSELLLQATRSAGDDAGRVVVLSIPDWSVTPFAAGRDRGEIRGAIDRFNTVNRNATSLAGARYVDVTPISREAAWDGSLLAADGLHPSGNMYRRWVDIMYLQVRAAIEWH